MSDSVRPHGLQAARLLCPWDSPGKNSGVGCHFHLQVTSVGEQGIGREKEELQSRNGCRGHIPGLVEGAGVGAREEGLAL